MREWLITNGIGGYAASTDFGGMNTRRYHGLLIAPLNPPGQRKLILSKVDESIEIDGAKYNLFTNDVDGKIQTGYKNLKKFEKEAIPVYTYKVNGVIIEKSICMIYGKNAVVVVYKVANKKAKTKLKLTPLVNFRDFHSEHHDMNFQYNEISSKDKCQIQFGELLPKINIAVKNSKYHKYEKNIFYNMHYKVEQERGFDCLENHLVPGTFEIDIKPNEDKTITFVCALDEDLKINKITDIDGEQVIKDELTRIKTEIKYTKLLIPNRGEENKKVNEMEIERYNELVKKFVIASDNFIVYRKERNLHTTVAGYPWFLDWGRDSYISFEGLLLITKRYDIAKEVLLTFAEKVKDGIVPNGFSEYTGDALYNSVDASLLFINAVYKYLQYTNDYDFVKQKLYKTMKVIIDKYIDGIDLDGNNIYVDEKDYLLVSGTPDTQNTWMDAKVDGKAVTPRNGKAVEINALWYNALRVMEEINAHYKKALSKIEYAYLSKKCKENFTEKFYNEKKKCLYDVIKVDRNEFETFEIGKDDKIRPNQIFALGLPFPVMDLNDEIAKNVFITVTEKLYNKYGLKTLAEGEEGYVPIYQGNGPERDRIYHQGITWVWLLGPYYDALKNLINAESNEKAKAKLEETLTQFKITTADTFANEINNGNTIGSIAEVYDSKEPDKNVRKLQVMTNDLIERDEIGWVFEKNVMRGKGAFAQAWSVSEVFRIILGK